MYSANAVNVDTDQGHQEGRKSMDKEQQSQRTHGGGEFEREPVPKSALLGFKSFVGMYAGEHCLAMRWQS
jgi:hypothetical protein